MDEFLFVRLWDLKRDNLPTHFIANIIAFPFGQPGSSPSLLDVSKNKILQALFVYLKVLIN
jgi:hypothetical protein